MMNTDTRLAELDNWLKEYFGNTEYLLTPVSGDASFRRYFRFISQELNYIAVDSPPEKENNEAFVHVTHLLGAEGLPVPHIYYSSLDFGFFLISDLGNELLLNVLNDENANELYKKSLNALAVIQQTSASSLPLYDEKLLLQEMELFREWFLKQHLSYELSKQDNEIFDKTFNALMDNALQQPQVFVHRDYHSRNLMNIEGKYPGIIDYQDAVQGPFTYDLVSLLRDCYIAWPEEKIKSLALEFYNNLNNDIVKNTNAETFLKWFDLMGIQRHLKAIGIFSRLNIRDNKPNYLSDIPRTLNYIKEIAKNYTETKQLAEFVNKIEL